MAKRTPQPVLPEYDKVYVGLRFKALRKTQGATLTQWADAIGLKCSPQKLCNYEQGEDQVPVPYAAQACILTGASFDYIYRGMVKGLPRKLRAAISVAQHEQLAEALTRNRPTSSTSRRRRSDHPANRSIPT